MICTNCHLHTEPDDIVTVYDAEWCLCLACHARATGTAVRVPLTLRVRVLSVLAAIEAI